MAWTRTTLKNGHVLYQKKRGRLAASVSTRMNNKPGWYWTVVTADRVVAEGTTHYLFMARLKATKAMEVSDET